MTECHDTTGLIPRGEPVCTPDYHGASIVNLLSSIGDVLGAAPTGYPPLRSLPPERLRDAQTIVLLVIDGLGYQYLVRRLHGGLLRECLRARLTSVFPPTTATAITTLLTGYAPQQHGFTGWFTYFKELAAILAVLPFRARFGGSALGAAGISPRQLCGCRPFFDRVDGPCDLVMPAPIAQSDFNRAFRGRARVLPFTTLAQLFVTLGDAIGDGSRRRYIYAYWPKLDALAHTHGVSSPAVYRHLQEIDAALVRFLHSLRGSGTTLLVTADHGFIDTPPHHTVLLEDHPELAASLVMPLSGEPRLAYCYVQPDRAERFEAYVQNELSPFLRLYHSADLVQQGWYGLGEMHPRLLDRVGHYALAMKQDYVVRDSVLAEKPHDQIGVHGGISEEELYVPLIVVEA